MKITSGVFGGALLVSGTCIGAGMLGLPVMMAASGFYPTLAAFLLVWFFMTCSALAYLEVSLRFHGNTNLISMAGETLGPVGKICAWVTYVLFLYSLMAAYTAGGTSMSVQILNLEINGFLEWLCMAVVFVAPFAWFVYRGASWVDHFNRWLMFGLIFTFIGLCVLAFKVGPADEFQAVGDPKYLTFTFPLLVTAFGYHLLIPTLKTYLHDSIRRLRVVILIGSLMALVVYSVWVLIILNLVPTWGDGGLVQMLGSGMNPADAMIQALDRHGKLISQFIVWFCFFALTSSFVGVGLGIFDFFSDGLKIRRTHKGRIILSALTFLPPMIYTIVYPQGFLYALKYAGIFAAVLLIIFPVTMAWRARYMENLPSKYEMRGGNLMLLLTLLFGLFVVFADVLQQLQLAPIPHN